MRHPECFSFATKDSPFYDIDRHKLDLPISKSQSKSYQNIHDPQSLQTSTGRILIMLKWRELRRKPYARISLVLPYYLGLNRSVQGKNLQSEPRKKFMPGPYLASLVEKHMIYPEEGEVIDLLKEIKKEMGSTADIIHNIKTIITEQVEGLITSLAKHTFTTKESIKISKDNRFTPEICKDLTNRLGLDPYDPRPVLDQLYHELFGFVSLTPRERVWGKIVVEDSELKLILA